MNELSLRQYLIIKTLNEHSKALTSNELCALLNISPRTLRYDIKDINMFAKSKLICSSKNGYELDKSMNISQYLKEYKISDYLETLKRISLILLENRYVSIYDLEEQCFISASSIISSIKQLSARMEVFNLQLIRKGDTLTLVGSEYNKRRMLSHFFFSEIHNFASSFENFNDYFTEFQLVDIKEVVEETLQELHMEVSGIYLKNIIISLAIILQRSINTNAIETDATEDTYATDGIDYQFLVRFLEKMNELYQIRVSEQEFSCMMNFISGLLRDNHNMNIKEQAQLQETEFLDKIHEILNLTFHHFGLDIDYKEFFDSFALHIHYLIRRARSKNFFKNDLASSLKHSHPYLYDVSIYIAFLIEENFIVKITDDEIGLIVIYLGTLIQSPQPYHRARVICICPKYNDLRQLFISQVSEHCSNQVEIVQVVSSYQEIHQDIEFDFIITALRSEYILDNAIYVSPLITPREIHMIEKKYMDVLKLQKHEKLKTDLLTYFDSNLFYYNHGLQDGMEILKFLNQQLVDKHIVSEEFLEDVLKREEMSSSAFFEKFAIPHAMDVKSYQTKIVYYYSDRPIDWFGTEIHLVMLFSSAGYDEDFSNIYNLLFDTLIENKLYQQLTSSKSFQDFFHFLIDKA